MSEPSAMDLLLEAASQMVQERDPNAIMTTAILVYETSEVLEDGQILYESNYSVVTDTSLSSAVGLLEVGKALLLDSAIKDDDDE